MDGMWIASIIRQVINELKVITDGSGHEKCWTAVSIQYLSCFDPFYVMIYYFAGISSAEKQNSITGIRDANRCSTRNLLHSSDDQGQSHRLSPIASKCNQFFVLRVLAIQTRVIWKWSAPILLLFRLSVYQCAIRKGHQCNKWSTVHSNVVLYSIIIVLYILSGYKFKCYERRRVMLRRYRQLIAQKSNCFFAYIDSSQSCICIEFCKCDL